MADLVYVYPFVCDAGGARMAPSYVQGTLEAIGRLEGCTPLLDMGRCCDASLLEDGFLFLR